MIFFERISESDMAISKHMKAQERIYFCLLCFLKFTINSISYAAACKHSGARLVANTKKRRSAFSDGAYIQFFYKIIILAMPW